MLSSIAVYHLQRYVKKLLLFDLEYNLIHEEIQLFDEISDNDGTPCEDLNKLTNWLLESWTRLEADERFDVKAVNFTAYGPALVHLNQNSIPVLPLFDYRKPLPKEIETKFFAAYGPKEQLELETCSPYVGMGNAGLQLYWLKHSEPQAYKKIKTTLFLPQYCSFLFTTHFLTDYTALGASTLLWDFKAARYEQWAYEEGIADLLPKTTKQPEAGLTPFRHDFIPVGTGLLDTVSGLIPLIKRNVDPFLLLGTGSSFTVLNPFAEKELTLDDLKKNCFCYLSFTGMQVKANRLPLGELHDQFTKKFASHFYKDSGYHKSISYSSELTAAVSSLPALLDEPFLPKPGFKSASLDVFESYELAYHKLLADITRLVLQSLFLAGENLVSIKKMYVEGDFAQNPLFMRMLSDSLPQLKTKPSTLEHGPALGAAMAVKPLIR